MLAAACAHQFVAEPLDGDAVVAQVARAFALREGLATPELRAIVGRMTAIPTLPALYTSVVSELQRLHVSTQRIGELISDDPAMAAKVLQLVNSPFFGSQMRVSDPALAVQRLGLETVRGLVLSTHVFETFRRPTRGVLNMEHLWQHAATVATLAGSLAQIDGAPTDVVQDARTAGLLHDVGKLLLVATLPIVAMRVTERARREGRAGSRDRARRTGRHPRRAGRLSAWTVGSARRDRRGHGLAPLSAKRGAGRIVGAVVCRRGQHAYGRAAAKRLRRRWRVADGEAGQCAGAVRAVGARLAVDRLDARGRTVDGLAGVQVSRRG